MNSIIYKGDWIINESEVKYDNPWIKLIHHKVITQEDLPVYMGRFIL